jgi:hypothetical protein
MGSFCCCVQVPLRLGEICMSVVSQNIKIFIEAYILGTLFYYIVRRCRLFIHLHATWC